MSWGQCAYCHSDSGDKDADKAAGADSVPDNPLDTPGDVISVVEMRGTVWEIRELRERSYSPVRDGVTGTPGQHVTNMSVVIMMDAGFRQSNSLSLCLHNGGDHDGAFNPEI